MGLQEAYLSERPKYIPKKKNLRGAQAKGMAFQRLIQRKLHEAFPGEVFTDQWIRYRDLLDWGWAEIDAFILRPECVVCCEIKLTQQDHAFYQMEARYEPLLRFIYQRPVYTLQVCKYLVERIRPSDASNPEYLLTHRPAPGRYTWHVLG